MALCFVLIMLRIFVDVFALYVHEFDAGMHSSRYDADGSGSVRYFVWQQLFCFSPVFLTYSIASKHELREAIGSCCMDAEELEEFFARFVSSQLLQCHVFSLNRCMIEIFILSLNSFLASTLTAIK